MENSDNKFGIVMEKPKTEPPNNDVLNYDSDDLSPQCHTVVSELLDLTKCDRLDSSSECDSRIDSSGNWSPPESILRQALMSFATAEEKTVPCYDHGKDDLKDTDEIFHEEDLKIFPPNFFNDNAVAKPHQLDPQQFPFFPSENNPLLPDTLSGVSQVCPLNNNTFISVPPFVPSSSSVANLSDSSQLSFVTSVAQLAAPPQITSHFSANTGSLSNKCDGSLCDLALPTANGFVPKQDTAFSSSKDVTMDVAFSAVPKTENSLNIDDSVPLPLLSNLKSSLSQDIPENHSNPSNLDREVLPTTMSSSATFDSVNDEDVPKFLDSGVSDVCESENGIKIDIKSDDSSDFSHNTLMSLPDTRLDSSISQSTLLPMSSDIILNKNEHSTSVEQIITIPNTVCGSELNIPLSVPVSSDTVHSCNSVVSGDSAQVASVRDPRLGQTPSWQNHGISVATLSSTRDRIFTDCSVFGPNTTATSTSSISITGMMQATGALQLSDMSAQSLDVSVQPSQSSTPDQLTSVVTSFSALDTSSYAVQSPAEILSQLSRAGAFPAMTSSQVSSVLSALNAEFNQDGETDTSSQDDLSNEQILQPPVTTEKVSTLTQTDDISLTGGVCQEDKKIGTDVQSPAVVSDRSDNTTNQSCKATAKPEAKDRPEVVTTQDVPALVNHIPLYTKIVAIILKTTQAEVKKSAISVDHSSAKNSTDCSSVVPANPTEKAHKKEEITSPPHVTKQKSVSVKPKSKLLNEERPTNAKLSGKLKKKKPKNSWSKPNRNCSARHTLTKNSAVKRKRRKKPKQNDEPFVSKFVEKVFCYKCKFCPFISLQKSAVSVHIEKEHVADIETSSGSVQLRCFICQRIYESVALLKEHLISVHSLTDEKAKDFAAKALFKNRKLVVNCDAQKKTSVVDKSIKNNSSEISTNVVEKSEKQKDKTFMEKSRIRVKNLESEKVLFSEVSSSAKEKDTAAQEVATFNGQGNDIIISTVLDQPAANLTDLAQQNEGTHEVNSYNYKPAWLQCRVLVKEEGVLDSEDEKLRLARKRGRPKGSRNQSAAVTTRKKIPTNSTNEKEIGFSCNIDNCAVRMRSLENIEYHRQCHNGAQYSCPECSHVHCHWNGMSTHLWRAHLINMELFSCDQCSYKTTSYSKLINMHKRIHGSERPFLCDTCGKGFKNTKQLRNHRSIHYANSKTRQEHEGECDVCGRSFSTLRKLRLHKDNVHHKVRRHLCSNCGYCASSISSLKMHMRQHTGEKPFKCNECDYQTSDHNSLRRHKMRHSGAKPYKCPHCTYACIQSSTYKAHIKTKHPGLDNGLMFSCNECNFHTVKEDNYLAHLGEHKLGTFPANKKLKKLQEEDNGGFYFDMPFETDYVAHLVEPLLVDGTGMQQHIPELSVRAVENIAEIQFDPGPENEQTMGDFQEPRELKFSVLEQAAP